MSHLISTTDRCQRSSLFPDEGEDESPVLLVPLALLLGQQLRQPALLMSRRSRRQIRQKETRRRLQLQRGRRVTWIGCLVRTRQVEPSGHSAWSKYEEGQGKGKEKERGRTIRARYCTSIMIRLLAFAFVCTRFLSCASCIDYRTQSLSPVKLSSQSSESRFKCTVSSF